VSEAVRAKRLMEDAKVGSKDESSFVQPILDRAAQEMFLTEIFRTMWLVFEQMWKPGFTIMYPQEKGPLSPRFRGEHALRRYPTGKRRTVFWCEISFVSTIIFVFIACMIHFSLLQAKNAVLLVNCVKPFVLLRQSQSRLNREKMVADERLDTTLT
jgi:uncharacterized membrane protein